LRVEEFRERTGLRRSISCEPLVLDLVPDLGKKVAPAGLDVEELPVSRYP